MGFDNPQSAQAKDSHQSDLAFDKLHSAAYTPAKTFADDVAKNFTKLDGNQSGFITQDELSHAASNSHGKSFKALLGNLDNNYSDLTKLSIDRFAGKEPGVSIGDLSNLDWCAKHGTGFGSSLVMGWGNLGLRHIGLSTAATIAGIALFGRNLSLGQMLLRGIPIALGSAELASTVEWRVSCKPSMDNVLENLSDKG